MMKSKKVLAPVLLLAVLLTCFAAPVYAVDEDRAIYRISDCEGLYSIADDPYGTYLLDCDIDMSGSEWMPLEFYGVFDGQGHNVFNLSINEVSDLEKLTFDGNMKRYTNTRFAGLFSYVLNAEIKNLNLYGVNIDITSEYPCYCAAIAGMAEFAVIENCSVYSSVWLHASGMSDGVAGLVGFGNVVFRNCSVDSELVFIDEVDPAKKCEQFLGGLLANGVCDMYNNDVNVQGYVSTHGFVHSGGMVGMSFRLNYELAQRFTIGNTVSGTVTFYEQNWNRRAYCAPIVAEVMYHWVQSEDNNTEGFVRNEIFEYDRLLLPEMCENPEYTETVTECSCTSFGYTQRTCTGCGYTRTYNYVPAQHIKSDEPVLVSEASYESEGVLNEVCRFCGLVMGEIRTPMLVKSEECRLSHSEITLGYKGEYTLTAQLSPENLETEGFTWHSANPEIAVVDENGRVCAVSEGVAEIICESNDGFTSAVCVVNVIYSAKEKVSSFFDDLTETVGDMFNR